MTDADNDLERLNRLIRESPKGPQGFSDLVATWNGFFDGPSADADRSAVSSIAERASADVIADFDHIPEADLGESTPPDLDRLLGSFRFPVLLTGGDGTILSANFEAMGIPEVAVGGSVEALDIALEKAEPLGEAIGKVIREDGAAGPVLKQGYAVAGTRATTIAILPTRARHGNSTLALVFLIDLTFRAEAAHLMAESADLTGAEREVLEAFVKGRDLPDIALERGSSLATVRTQFQSILKKTSAGTQAGLLRRSFALSGFVDALEETAQAARHPHRKSAEILRPGGRKIDVTLAGRLDGEVVIFLANATQKSFQPQIEAAFAAAGLCVASICRPGTGRTDMAPEGTDIDICMADDVDAVLKQLGVDHGPLLTNSTSAAFGFRTAQLLGARIDRLVVVSGFPPAPYIAAQVAGSPFASAMIRAARSSPTMLALLTRSGITAWKLLGTRRFLSMQLANNPDDIALATRPECLAEFEAAFQASLARGTDASTYELRVGTLDWSPWVKECPCPVDWLHGTKDAAVNIEAVRALVADYPDSICLHELNDAGWMLMFSHTEEVLKQLP